MVLLGKRASEIDVSDLELLVRAGRVEDDYLEYKRELPGSRDADKREFLADVASFANADGGLLVYGMEESDGRASALSGIGRDASDEDTLRLQDLMRAGIEPRISGVSVRRMSLENGNGVALVSIPKSWNAPHRVVASGSNRFWKRQGGQKFEMNVEQLRTAFSLLGTERDRLAAFRAERLKLIRENEVPLRLFGESRLVVHVLPLPVASATLRIDLSSRELMRRLVQPHRRGAYYDRYNVDGFLRHQVSNEKNYSYYQVFRSGAVEFVDAWSIRRRDATDEQPRRLLIETPSVEAEIFHAYALAASVQREFNVEGPLVVFIGLLSVAGFCLAGMGRGFHDVSEPTDRTELLLSDLMISDAGAETPGALRPLLDELWNAFGLPRCLQYDADGNWIA